jgi:shikimate kinase
MPRHAEILTKPSRTIVLVGMMGAGKTAIGTRLAKKLDIPFYDADKVIEERACCSISDIFAYAGEPEFRKMEAGVIRDLLEGNVCVLATGGGAFLQENVRTMILEKGIAIWLDAPFEVLLDRVSRKKTRPLLEKGDKATILKELMDIRVPVYAKAPIRIESGKGPHATVVKRVIEALQQH